MPKFSFLSWNVRQYYGDAARLKEADALISGLDPDIFGMIEFKAKPQIRELMWERFPEYDFAVTDSSTGLEMLVGFRRGTFKQVIWTQKRTFNNQPRTLRPGALISAKHGNQFYNLLFLHTDSGGNRTAYRERWKVFKKVWKLRDALQAASPSGRANLIVLGDLNTMGNGASIDGGDEIRKLSDQAESHGMVMLGKDAGDTWHEWGKGPRNNRRKLKVSELATADRSNLDHVLASDDLDFVAHGSGGEAIHVEGFQQLSGSARVRYLWGLSDHSALFGEVW